MNMLLVAALVLMVGLALAMIEVFIPSGGLLGFLSLVFVGGAVVLAFREGKVPGAIFLVAALIGLPTAFSTALKILPQTRFGKRVLSPIPTAQESAPPVDPQFKALEGKIGVAKCLMTPSGAIEIDGKTINAVSDGFPIEAGQKVRVIQAKANRVVVRLLTHAESAAHTSKDPDLSQPIEQVLGDPFEDLDQGLTS